MSLQGYLHADEYGLATSLVGGISLSMSIWKESFLSSVQTLWATHTHVPLPRAFVVAAIRETTRHPGLHTLPPLRRSLAEHMRRWDAFRDMEVRWMLRHTDLVGAIATEGKDVWIRWNKVRDDATVLIENQYRTYCRILPSTRCGERNKIVAIAKESLANATRAVVAWERALRMDRSLSLLDWWGVIGGVATTNFDGMTTEFYRALQALHDIAWPSDSRVRDREVSARSITDLVVGDIWTKRMVESLLNRDLWAA
jgi:hypothetical protein